MTVNFEQRGRVALLTIDRPDARNAVNGAVTTAMAAALDKAEADRNIWAVVLTGAGDKAFCAGMDLKAFVRGEVNTILDKRGGFGGIVSRPFTKPLIAAVNGHALAGGFEVMLSCDLAVAAEEATFGLPEVTRGLLAAAGGLIRLPKRLPLALALELAMTGDPISAQRAYDLGLVNRVVPRAQVLDEALALANRICENSPIAVRTSRQLVREAVDLDEAAGWKRNNELSAVVLAEPDAKEGATAFAERRAPEWQTG
jgi:enoyl-CoA hydratase/carnithine racemase